MTRGLVWLVPVVLVACSPAPEANAEKTAAPPPTAPAEAPASRKVAAAPSRAAPVPAMQNLAFDLSYRSRILVPAGADITLVVTGANGKVITTRSVKTEQDAPPYRVTVSVPASGPLRVAASLKSPIGHEFSQEVDVDPRKDTAGKPIGVLLQAR